MNQSCDFKLFNDSPGAHFVLKDVYSFFDKNLLSSVALYIGCTDWKRDLQLLETYSMPTVLCDPYDEQVEWREALEIKGSKFMDWLKYLKDNGCGNHFVNPKWIKASVEYPSNFSGMRTFDGDANRQVPIVSWDTLIERANGLRGNQASITPHFALCRIEVFDEEIAIVNSLLSSKYRPSLIYVRWSASPDESQQHCEAAGHLQTAGYRLVSISTAGFFMYQFTGQDVYSCCSWTKPSMTHPFIDMMREAVVAHAIPAIPAIPAIQITPS